MTEEQLKELGEANLTKINALDIDLDHPEDFLRMSSRAMGHGGSANVIDALVIAFPCQTFTKMAKETNKRYIDNHFMGVSSKAYEANLFLMHTLGLCFTMRMRNPQMQILIENPEGGLAKHPLIRLAQRSEQAGGLGLTRVNLCYCCYQLPNGPVPPRKATDFWMSRQLARRFLDTPLNQCQCQEKHKEGARGNSETGQRQICAYPKLLVNELANCLMKTESTRRNRGDAAQENYDYCSECDCDSKTCLLVCCDECPRVFHRACLVEAARGRADGGGKFRCEVCEYFKDVSWGGVEVGAPE